MANNRDRNNSSLGSWILPIILLFTPLAPVGVLLLVLKLFGVAGRGNVKRHPCDIAREGQAPAAPPKKSRAKTAKSRSQELIPDGKKLILGGGIATGIFGIASVSTILDALYWLPGDLAWFLQDTIPVLCFFALALGVLLYGIGQKKKGRRFRKYLNLIGKRTRVDLDTMAQVGGIRKQVLSDDLQEMLDKGILPAGYLDLMSDRLVLGDEGVPEREETAAPESAAADLSREDAILAEIRQLNDDIDHEKLSAQIDEIETITRKIFRQLRDDPAKEPQLRGFLNYYLPTTLKILHAYAQLESQGIEGDNITAAKERIEGMMDKVVEGFEKQLDKLFEHDAMDITTDVEVLEKMLKKDGLSAARGMQLEI